MKTIIIIYLLAVQTVVAREVTFLGNYTPSQKQIVLTELAKYPKNLIEKNLKTVAFIDAIGNHPNACGRSSAFSATIEIVNRISNRISDDILKQTIHHELSSVLIIRYDVFVKTGFADSVFNLLYHLNKDKYNASFEKGVTKLSNEDSDYYLGNTYAKTEAENDFNMICETMFADGTRVVELSKLDKPISKKIRIIMAVYHTYDPIFTLEYFKKMK